MVGETAAVSDVCDVIVRALRWLGERGIEPDPRACAALREAIPPLPQGPSGVVDPDSAAAPGSSAGALAGPLEVFASSASLASPASWRQASADLHWALGELFDRAERGAPVAVVTNALMFALENSATQTPDAGAVAVIVEATRRAAAPGGLSMDDALDLVDSIERAGLRVEPSAFDRLASTTGADFDGDGDS